MTREEVEALIEIVEAACTAFDDSPSPCWYSIPVLGSDLRSLISLARRVPVLEEALRPFAEAADSIDKETPPNLRCPEDMSIGDALWEHDQPIVHDLRRARAALTPTEEGYGRSPGMDALPEAERVRLFRREETSGFIGYGRRKALFMALTDAFAFPDQTDLTPLVEGLHALNASIAPDQTDATVGSGDMPAEIWSYPFDPETDGNGAWTPGGPGRRFGAGFTRYVRADAPPPVTGGEWPTDAQVERAITGFYRDDEKWKRGSPTSLQRLRDDMRNALIAVAPPPVTGGEWPDDVVERVARIIDPHDWSNRDSYVSMMEEVVRRRQCARETVQDIAAERVKSSLAKAKRALFAAAPPPAQASSPKPEGEAQGGAAPCYLCTEKHLRGWRVIAGFERREDAEAFHDSLAIVRPSLQALEDILSPPAPPEITDEVVARFHVIFWDLYNSGKNASTAMRRVLTEFQKSGGVG